MLTRVYTDLLCSLLLSLETPNDIRSVASQSENIQAISKGSVLTVRMHIPHCWKCHFAAQLDLSLVMTLPEFLIEQNKYFEQCRF